MRKRSAWGIFLLFLGGCGGSGIELHEAEPEEITRLPADVNFRRAMGRSMTDELIRTRPVRIPKKGSEERPVSQPGPLVVLRGNRQEKLVALTFDDSPYARWTPMLLDQLSLLRVKATFFCVGSSVERFPAIVREIASSGHEIGNHSYNHIDLAWLSQAQVMVQIRACNEALRRATGKVPVLLRPPGGNYDTGVLAAAKASGMTLAFWSANVGDYRRASSAEIVRIAMERIGPGSIVVLHDGISNTLAALPTIVTKLRNKGYRFVTVSELISRKKSADDVQSLSYHALGLKRPKGYR